MKKILIVGGGVAGLSAGSYGQMCGIKTEIFEASGYGGGLFTEWTRKGYSINAGVHWMVGANDVMSINRIWKELNAVQGRDFFLPAAFMKLQTTQGVTVTLFSDADEQERHFLEIAPEDRDLILDLMGDVKEFSKHDMPVLKPPRLYTLKEGKALWAEFAPVLKIMNKYRSVSIEEYANRFKNAALREAIINFWLPELSMIFLFLTWSWCHMKASSYPIGGPKAVAEAIVKRYEDLGGVLRRNARVKRIIVEKRKAVGVELENGECHYGDHVISAADGHTTVFGLLGGKFVGRQVKKTYEKMHQFPAPIHVAIGVAKEYPTLDKLVFGVNMPVKSELRVGNARIDRLTVLSNNHDPSRSPKGKTLFECMMHCDYDYWKELSLDPAKYKAEKEKIAQFVIDCLDEKYGGVRENLDMVDVSTPMTYQRYAGIWKAGYEGWMITPDTYKMKLKKKLPGLKNFEMIGQWVEMGGGVPASAISGRQAIQLFCHREKIPFTASIPE